MVHDAELDAPSSRYEEFMPENGELRALVESAGQAAAVGDYASAEQLLRKAALAQEASLGPFHPDLANTLNNLAVVCEITGKLGEAEHFFRRASSIAAAALEPEHPFVATSRKNLEDFCRARGTPVAPPGVASASSSRSSARSAVIAGMLVVVLIAAAIWFGTNGAVESIPEGPAASPPAAQAAAAVAKPVESSRGGDATAPTPDAHGLTPLPPAPPTTASSDERRDDGRRPAPTSQAPQVAAAHLCGDLPTRAPGGSGEWTCDPPTMPVRPGSIFFYTRVTSPADTTVRHRWYRGDRLHQVVELPIGANTTGGYRTYSRNTIDNQGGADWRVELTTLDGVVLHEERFTVR
jgi:hypothetical protein